VVDIILDRAGQKGTGKWSVIEAQQLGIPATAIEAAVAARVLSSIKDERLAAEKAYGNSGVTKISADKDALLDDLELALFAGKISAYSQGFAVMSGASKEFNWNLPMPTIAKIWRAGCIIRASLLSDIRQAFDRDPALVNLLLDEAFRQAMADRQDAWRYVVQTAVGLGIPVPAMGSSLAYYDSYRSARLPANLTQAQRDFFGAHTYRRVDREGVFHTEWGGEPARPEGRGRP
jgi:6-phosphogluconate dehydrogenase